MDNNNAEQEFWKQKLMAFLHDPPCKPLDFSPKHEEIAWQFCASENMTELDKEVFKNIKDADWMASAADRMSFKSRKCSNKFTGQKGETFKHPLSGDEYLFKELPTIEYAEELLQNAIGGIQATSEDNKWKDTFFLYWRRWLEEVIKIEGKHSTHFPYYPAETRLADHSIWNHMSLTSALQGCRNDKKVIKPSFISFNLGPVQEFIAQARSTQDLWSGSYMLAWLTAHAMKAVSDINGPDSIIFPSLRGQAIFDVLYRDELYAKIKYKGKGGSEDSLWKRMYNDGGFDEKVESAKKLLNPTLPNRFLALVPEYKAVEIAKSAEKAIICELRNISKSCWDVFANAGSNSKNWKERWDKQVELFPQISWSVTPWEHDVDKALKKFAQLPINKKWNENSDNKGLSPAENLKKVIGLSKKAGYNDDGKPVNSGSLWAANYALAEFAMSARRNCREFNQFITDENQLGTIKDSLSGKEEIIGDEEFWKSDYKKLFNDNEGPYGAINIIKRLWVKHYLFEKLDIDEKIFKDVIRFASVPAIAKNNDDTKSPYVAIIAMDGDEMGKWICGAKTPLLYDQICQNAKDFLGKNALNDIKRPISSGYHLQFSETLANFANHLAGKVVEHYEGQLIYAGGDDVLAMVPADKAIKCARTLRAVFRGVKDELPDDANSYNLHIEQNGFVRIDAGYALMVPGPTADLSCGIAIGHKNYPLQHLVKEAQSAEKRAKKEYNRSAFAISLMKRGGEQINWGAKWEWNAIELFDNYCELRKSYDIKKKRGSNACSSRFPYALAALLKPYKLDNEFESIDLKRARDIISIELIHVMEQQGGGDLSKLCDKYLKKLENELKLDDFVKLFLTAAFIERERGE